MFNDDDFEKQFQRMQKLVVAGYITYLVVGIAGWGFAVWVIYVLLKHFGIV